MRTLIVALVGMPAAGKSTVAAHLSSTYGYNWIRTRDIVRSLGAGESIESLQSAGLHFSAGAGSVSFCQALFARVETDRVNVVDSIRPIDHWVRLSAEYKGRAVLVAISAPKELRNKRLVESGRRETFEARETHSVEADIPSLIDASSYNLVNCDSFEFRTKQVAEFINYTQESKGTAPN